VPPGSAHCDEAVTDVGPEREARAATKGFEFPPHIEATPLVLKHIGSVGSRHRCFQWRGRSHPGELYGSNRTKVPIGLKGRPLAQVRRVGKRLPDFFRRVAQFSDENERPLVFLYPILDYLRPAGRTWCVLPVIGHLLLHGFLFVGVD